ncbi:glutaredoxin family protein [Nitrosomonas halophila]|uniref:Glutaredoxin-like domain n=1 Tax=Nitrosomonas halophila TaxID=44576 RepID=A0A1H3ESE2_9PROT|nr:glutaredoxin family protein [Nitrosomonas halophila]SDX80839.1 Glutaredoxin-like domain [Nitrosomonas halophila]
MNDPVHQKKLIVYAREGCHLCDEMISSLGVLQKENKFEFDVVDIDSDAHLVGLYTERVPVLYDTIAKKELCHYFLDQAVFDAYLAAS